MEIEEYFTQEFKVTRKYGWLIETQLRKSPLDASPPQYIVLDNNILRSGLFSDPMQGVTTQGFTSEYAFYPGEGEAILAAMKAWDEANDADGLKVFPFTFKLRGDKSKSFTVAIAAANLSDAVAGLQEIPGIEVGTIEADR